MFSKKVTVSSDVLFGKIILHLSNSVRDLFLLLCTYFEICMSNFEFRKTKGYLQLEKGKITTCRIIGVIRIFVEHLELNPSLRLTMIGSGGKTLYVSLN